MTPEEILNGNKLIAEFMVIKFDDCDFTNDRSISGNNCDAVRYHRDWSWLMPVVEKINNCCQKTGYVDGISLFDFRIVGTPIIDVWQGCIDYIQWYNTYNQSQKAAK